MKLADFLHPNLIWTNAQVEHQSHLFEMAAETCEQLGYVTKDFLKNIKKREATFPTGLQLDGYGVAIPHTDPEHIKEEFIAVITTDEGVPFKLMDDASQETKANVVFMLGLNSPHNQLNALQQLIQVIQSKENVASLLKAGSSEEITQILAAN